MRVRLPAPADKSMEPAYDKIEAAFSQVAGREEAIDRVLLRGDDGLTYALSVVAGALTIAAFSGKTRDV